MKFLTIPSWNFVLYKDKKIIDTRMSSNSPPFNVIPGSGMSLLWEQKQTHMEVKYFLQKVVILLTWDKLYIFHLHLFELGK